MKTSQYPPPRGTGSMPTSVKFFISSMLAISSCILGWQQSSMETR